MNKKGFTLIELLGTIVVLSLLVIISLPIVNNIINNSKKGVDDANINEILNAAYSWAIDENLDNYLPIYENESIVIVLDTIKKSGHLTKNIKDAKTGTEYGDNCPIFITKKTYNKNEVEAIKNDSSKKYFSNYLFEFGCVEQTINISYSYICPDCVFAYTSEDNKFSFASGSETTLTSSQYKTNYQDVVAETGNAFLGLVLDEDGKIKRAYACGMKGNLPLCIEGALDNSHGGSAATRSNVRQRNKAILVSPNYYNNGCTDSTNITCNNSKLSVGVYYSGGVLANAKTSRCLISNIGEIYCQ